jgi:hypothetical protein
MHEKSPRTLCFITLFRFLAGCVALKKIPTEARPFLST